MRIARMILVCVLGVMLGGCAYTWVKPGMSNAEMDAQYDKDYWQCKTDCMPYAASPGKYVNPMLLSRCTDECLTRKGWTKRSGQ